MGVKALYGKQSSTSRASKFAKREPEKKSPVRSNSSLLLQESPLYELPIALKKKLSNKYSRNVDAKALLTGSTESLETMIKRNLLSIDNSGNEYYRRKPNKGNIVNARAVVLLPQLTVKRYDPITQAEKEIEPPSLEIETELAPPNPKVGRPR